QDQRDALLEGVDAPAILQDREGRGELQVRHDDDPRQDKEGEAERAEQADDEGSHKQGPQVWLELAPSLKGRMGLTARLDGLELDDGDALADGGADEEERQLDEEDGAEPDDQGSDESGPAS